MHSRDIIERGQVSSAMEWNFRQRASVGRVVLQTLAIPVTLLGLGINAYAQQAAFPGAEGGGAGAEGGRNGRVLEVSSLADRGPGTLRACIENGMGPRTCVFRVGGVIQLESTLEVNNPHLTVAGQTAPGGGIMLTGKGFIGHMVLVSTHDVIWRYTRIRKGYVDGSADDSSGFVTESGAYNVIFDHNSVSWSMDDLLNSWHGNDEASHSLTYSWNIVAEGLEAQSTGVIVGAKSTARADSMVDVDFHHNLMMSNHHRAPLLKNKSSHLTSNIFYNHYSQYAHVGGGIHADIVANIFKRGPLDDAGDGANLPEIHLFTGDGADGPAASGNPSIYLSQNIGWNQSNRFGDQWRMTALQNNEDGEDTGTIPDAYRRFNELPGSFAPITVTSTDTLEGELLPAVGAARRLDCSGRWIDVRDAVDTRLVREYRTNQGRSRILTHEDEVGSFPVVATGTTCLDTDHDGIPNSFEQVQGMAYNDPSDANLDNNGNGYTNLEEYLAGNPPGATISANDASDRSCVRYSLKGVRLDNIDGGHSYRFIGPFELDTQPDTTDNRFRSTLRLFENDRELGPAHSFHRDIRDSGGGRFSHRSLADGSRETIRFSATDNSDPRSNGRSYSYCVPH